MNKHVKLSPGEMWRCAGKGGCGYQYISPIKITAGITHQCTKFKRKRLTKIGTVAKIDGRYILYREDGEREEL